MSLAAIVQNDHFQLGFIRSADNDGGKARQLVDLNGSYRTRNLDMKGMGGNAQINDLGLMTMLGNKKVLAVQGEAVSYEDVRTREQQLKIDLVRAFGSEIVAMGDFVGAVMEALAEGSPLSEAQKEQLLAVVNEMVTLKNLTRLGTLPEGQERLEAMIAETAEKLADLLIEGLDQNAIPQAVADFARNFLADVAQAYDLPAIEAKLVQIDRRINPQEMLRDAVAEVIQTLTERLEQDDIAEEERTEIEAVLEALQEAIEKDSPIPQATFMALQDLMDHYPAVAQETGLIAQVRTLKNANADVKAMIVHRAEQALEVEMAGNKSAVSVKEMVAEFIVPNVVMPLRMDATKTSAVTPPSTPVRIQTSSEPTPLPTPVSISAQTPSEIAPPPAPAPRKQEQDNPVAPPRGTPVDPHDPVDPPRNDPKPEKDPDPQPKPEDQKRKPDELPVTPPNPPKPEGGPTNDPKPDPDKKDDGNPKPDKPPEPDGCGDNCKCKDAFQKAAEKIDSFLDKTPDATLEELKSELTKTINGELSVEDALISRVDRLNNTQRQELISDMAENKFGGDINAAKNYVEGHVRLRQIEQEKAAQRAADENARNVARDRARAERTDTPRTEFNKKGCPTHGDSCPDGAHDTHKRDKVIAQSSDRTSIRKKKLEL